jgi:hypothetical protein
MGYSSADLETIYASTYQESGSRLWISPFFNPELPFINVEKGRLPSSTFQKLKKGKV